LLVGTFFTFIFKEIGDKEFAGLVNIFHSLSSYLLIIIKINEYFGFFSICELFIENNLKGDKSS